MCYGICEERIYYSQRETLWPPHCAIRGTISEVNRGHIPYSCESHRECDTRITQKSIPELILYHESERTEKNVGYCGFLNKLLTQKKKKTKANKQRKYYTGWCRVQTRLRHAPSTSRRIAHAPSLAGVSEAYR